MKFGTFHATDFATFEEDPDLNDLMEYVGVDLQDKWEAIALGLGIERINAIKKNHQGAPDFAQDCMREVFYEWKSNGPGEYSWKNLAAVLRSKKVGKSKHLKYLYTELSKKFSD